MAYTAKNFSHLIGIAGLSETLLKNHFTLYEGYVANTNKVLDALDKMLGEGKTNVPEYAELKRRLGWEFNGMRLHELYFENLSPGNPVAVEKGVRKEGRLANRLKEHFGGMEQWEKDFRSVGAMRGIGWAALYEDGQTGRLINLWINEHDVAHPSGCNPILIMDVFEHAYITDYGLKRADYIETFMKNINWEAAESRLK